MSDNFDNLSKSDQGFPEPGGGGSMSSRTDLSQAAQTGSQHLRVATEGKSRGETLFRNKN